jgi:hypothetical protein
MPATTKIDHAKRLFIDLNEKVKNFFVTGKPYEAISIIDQETGDLLVVAKINITPPSEEWSCVAGDIIHNVRSSLDHLVWDLVIANKQIPNRNNCFPITENEENFLKYGLPSLEGVDSKAIEEIKSLKPFRSGTEWLWQLHKLDIADKHRTLLIAGSAHKSVIIDMSQDFKRLNPEIDIPPMPIALRPAERDFPLKNGDVLFRVPAKSITPDMMGMPKEYEFEIAYSDRDVVKDESMLESLNKFINMADDIIRKFSVSN